MRKRKYFLSTLSLAIMLGSFAVPYSANASEVDNLQLRLTPSKDVDVVLTVGQTAVDPTNFKKDLTNKLAQKGVDVNKINISAIETQQTVADESSASTVFSKWKAFSILGNGYNNSTSTPNDFYISGDRIVRSNTGSTRPAQGFYDPSPEAMKTKDAEYTFKWGIHPTQHGSFEHGEAGFIFRMQDEKNYYAYLMDNHSICGNILMDGGEAIVKVVNGQFQILASAYGFPMYYAGQQEDIKIVTKGSNIQVFRNGKKVLETNDSTYTEGSHGFYVWDQYGAYFSNITLTTKSTKSFKEVIREPKWRETSKHFIVNIDDKKVPDFDDSSALGEILPRLINEEIDFIELGTETNKKQSEEFIAKNNHNGAFYSNSNYNTALENTANYIVQKLKEEENSEGQYVIVGEPIDIAVNPSSLATNTQTPEYPQGRWRIDHDYEYFENNLGQASWANQWQKDLQMIFDKPGKYDISFGDKHPNPRYVYAHRRPVASFATIVKNNGNNFGITIQDYSYDLDLESRTDKGIAEKEWKWRRTTDNNWTNGEIPSSLPIGNDYIVQLRVKDYQGTWSAPESRYITTSSIVAKPVANFNVSSNTISMYESLNISDTSYDPAGRTITDKLWVVKKGDNQIYSGSVPLTNFRSYGEGSYRISLKVKNDANLWSEEFARTINVTKDVEKPETIVSPTSQDWSTNSANINITFSDKGGSGFKHQRYAVTQSPTPPKSGWSEYSTSDTRNVIISEEGRNYLHIEGEDNAGNKFTRTIGEYQIDRTAPKLEYTLNPSTWTNKDVKIHLKASDSDSGVNRIQLPNGNWINETDFDYNVSTNGLLTFRVVDNAGNETKTIININFIDKVAPNSPTIDLDAPENKWVDRNITATIKDNGDEGDSGFRIEYRLSGSTNLDWTTYISPVIMMKDGITTISARVVDNAGNMSNEVSKTVKIDQTAPNLTITPDIKKLTNSDIVLTAIATDEATGVKRIQTPDGNWINSSEVSYRVSENGMYMFKAEDNFGNVRTVNYLVSNIKKNVLITNRREVDLDLHAEDVFSGVTHMQFRNEEQAWSNWESYSNSKEWLLTAGDGLKHVWVQYKDKVGNISSPIEDVIILDMTKPVASLLKINDDDEYTNTKSVTLKLKGSDNLTGVKDIYLSNDNKNWTKYDYTEEIPWLLSNGDGIKTVYLKISDVAGNISDAITDTIFLDTTKPLANITINNGDEYSPTREVQLTLNYSDIGGSGVDIVKVIEGDREYILPKPLPNSPVTIPWTLDFGVVKTVSIIAIDKAGNVSNLASDSIIVDKLTIEGFTLEDVVNPLEFNAKHPFTPKVWAFAPEPMIAGGNIKFSIDIKKAVDEEVVQDKVDYKVEVIGDKGYHKAFIGVMRKTGNHYTQTITIPKDAPQDAKVYVSATAQRKLLVSPFDVQTIYFPGGEDSSQKAQIGTIIGNIYDVIRFNETH